MEQILLMIWMAATPSPLAAPPFTLDSKLVERGVALREAAAHPFTDADLCRQLDATRQQARDLTHAMDQALVKAGIDADAATEESLNALQAEAVRSAAPGLTITANNLEFVEIDAKLDLAAFLSAVTVTPKAKGFLTAAAPLESSELAGLGFQQVTDVTVCCTFDQLTPTARATLAASADAPTCLREHYLPLLQKAIDTVAACTCFCQGRDAVAKQAQDLRDLLGKSTLPGGAASVKRLKSLKPSARYTCAPN